MNIVAACQTSLAQNDHNYVVASCFESCWNMPQSSFSKYWCQNPLFCFADVDCQVFICNFHTWGCSVFVLDGRLQSNSKGVPKWEPRCRVGVYIGHLLIHTGSFTLVLNPTTGHISPQFHVVLMTLLAQFHTCVTRQCLHTQPSLLETPTN